MDLPLVFKLLRSSFSICLLLPLYYLLGYGVLSVVNGVFKRSFEFKFEDVLVASLATLSFIVIGCKLVRVYPEIELIGQIAAIVAIACLILGLSLSKLNKIELRFPLPNVRYSIIWLALFNVYLLRAVIKARTLADAIYIPSRFNTDIFLYIRRSIVFLAQAGRSHSENGQTILDILYNSPKLLSTVVYTTFTRVSGDIGIAATLVTSIVLAAITLKCLCLINERGKYKLVTYATAALIIFQPIWCWLQDQFYWSNLLCIYLLIYILEDLLTSKPIDRWLIKYTLALTALAGFYPSQIPFFCLAAIAGLLFHPDIIRPRRYLLSVIGIAIVILCLFSTQYLDTNEVVKHFDLTDAKHGQNFNYIAFWTFLYFVPKTGGTPKDIGAILLISGSLLLAAIAIRYCFRAIPAQSGWFKLLFALYFLYSASYLLLPGEYRQSKFFFTYIVPLIVWCLIKVVNENRFRRKKPIQIILPALAVFVMVNSFDKPYKPHVSSQISTVITQAKANNKPLTVYTADGSIAHGYYYLAYQLRQLDFQLFTGCPQLADLESIQGDRTIIIAESCPKVTSSVRDKIIYTDINGENDD